MVKYADAPQASVEVRIDAEPAAVWPLVSDISLPAQFSPEFQGADWVDGGPALGATFHGHNKHQFVGEWTTTSTVTAYEEGAVFEWTVGDVENNQEKIRVDGLVENKTARWRFDLTPDGDGSSLRFSAEMGPGPSGLTMAIQQMPDREEEIVANRLGEWTGNMQATLDGIKGLAEG